jgi:hypothetical protein
MRPGGRVVYEGRNKQKKQVDIYGGVNYKLLPFLSNSSLRNENKKKNNQLSGVERLESWIGWRATCLGGILPSDGNLQTAGTRLAEILQSRELACRLLQMMWVTLQNAQQHNSFRVMTIIYLFIPPTGFVPAES